MRHMDANKIDSIATKVGGALKNLRINMNLAPVLDPPKDDRGKNGIISVSKHFLGYDSWTNNDLQISVSESPKENILENVRFFKTFAKDIPVTMMSSVLFTHISDRPAVMLTDDLWGTSLRAWAGNDIIMISYTSKAKNMLNIMMELSESDSKYKSRIEESAARILKLKYEMGILKL